MKTVRIGEYEVTLKVRNARYPQGEEHDTNVFLTWLQNSIYDCKDHYIDKKLYATANDYLDKWKSLEKTR